MAYKGHRTIAVYMGAMVCDRIKSPLIAAGKKALTLNRLTKALRDWSPFWVTPRWPIEEHFRNSHNGIVMLSKTPWLVISLLLLNRFLGLPSSRTEISRSFSIAAGQSSWVRATG